MEKLRQTRNIIGALGGATEKQTKASSNKKLMAGARITLFGHAKHREFLCRSTEFIDVPDTYSSSIVFGKVKFRLEVTFATNHDCLLGLRMFDPANPQIASTWYIELKGGHAPNTWWNYQVSDSILLTGDPWPRQSTLQMKSLDGSEAILGSVVIVVEEFTALKDK